MIVISQGAKLVYLQEALVALDYTFTTCSREKSETARVEGDMKVR